MLYMGSDGKDVMDKPGQIAFEAHEKALYPAAHRRRWEELRAGEREAWRKVAGVLIGWMEFGAAKTQPAPAKKEGSR